MALGGTILYANEFSSNYSVRRTAGLLPNSLV
jgi:hypothetical protein